MKFKSFFKNIIIENLDKTISIIGILMAIFLITFSIFIKRSNFYAVAGTLILSRMFIMVNNKE